MSTPAGEDSQPPRTESPRRAGGAHAAAAAEPTPAPTLGARLRRIVPGTVLGLAGLLFCMSIAAAFSGAVLYAYYESRQEETQTDVERFIGAFDDEVQAAIQQVQAEGTRARDEIQAQLEDLQRFAASGGTLTGLLDGAQPSVWFVSTLDAAGAPSVGSAFVVFADSDSSYLLASFSTVAAATQQPGPEVRVRKADQDLLATVFTWDAGRDLALLVIDVPNLPALTWAAEDSPARIGDRVFALSGLGASGAAITQGFVADVSADGIQHDAPVGPQFQGGPLINSSGEVVAVASRTYSPRGFPVVDVFFAPAVRMACEAVLRCPDGAAAPPG